MWLTIAASGAAGAAGFFFLYRLRDDPLPTLGETFRIAAFLQPIPFVAAAILAVFLRRRPWILGIAFAAVVACGVFGGWWLADLAEVRRVENEPTRRRAMGNIFPDLEGQVGAGESFVWPFAAGVIIGVATLVGWATSGRKRRDRESIQHAPRYG
jgi:hypothetical protein